MIPLAESAVETGSAEPVVDFLSNELKGQLRRRLDEVTTLAAGKERSVRDARRYVEAMLGSEVYCHRLSRRCSRRHTTGMAALRVPLPSRASMSHPRRCLRPISYLGSRAALG
ncbi:MAG: hypothetical protein K0S98_2803 [Propionibacteriaceae bacterium]|nr:hypothetical protein [Propionibacteriaceae bacterium]